MFFNKPDCLFKKLICWLGSME